MTKLGSDSPLAKDNHDSEELNSDTAGGVAPQDNNNGEVNRLKRNGLTLPPTNPFAAFDPANLRIDQSVLSRGVAKKLLTTIPIRKPNKQDFVRVNPSDEYRMNAAFIELKEDREIYLVSPSYVTSLSESEYFTATLYLCINRQKVLTFWPVRLPGSDGKQMTWHTSAAEGAEMAMTRWVRLIANMSLGAYEIFESEATLSEPDWPEQSMPELLSIAFKGRIIEGPEHLVMKRLRGEI